MARRLRQQRLRSVLIALLLLGGGAAAYYKVFFKSIRDAAPPARAAVKPSEPLRRVLERPEGLLAAESRGDDTPTSGASPSTRPTTGPDAFGSSPALTLMRAGLTSLGRGDLLDARGQLSEALALGLPAAESAEARDHLSRLADQTLFGPSIVPNDSQVIAHTIGTGETLAKIAKQHAITSDFLARINGITDKNRIRAGQRLKVIQGPFTAVISSATFDLDVFLGKTLVKHFKVGLGTDGSTPPGKWKVNNKLINPTYYPPRGGVIIAADDPKNPLGERWIGLVGLEGEAVGQERYGIHGTIEPDSIGKNMSLGCVRMLNPDVELLFELLVEEQSTVTIR